MGHCYQGFSALGILAEIYLKTNGSLEFSEVYGDEASPPPTWGNMRYEESIRRVDSSQRIRILLALNFGMTPEEILNKLKKISTEAF